jgi:hypothetical protein
LWDGIVSDSTERAAITDLARQLVRAFNSPAAVTRLDYESWMQESFELARTFVYTIPAPAVPPEYEKRAMAVGRERVTLAGLRIAAILNHRLQR